MIIFEKINVGTNFNNEILFVEDSDGSKTNKFNNNFNNESFLITMGKKLKHSLKK